jgi:branched-chain amino acid transport system permease protein
MEKLLNFIIIGLTIGCIYALIALGYTMVYGIVKLINFAHGDILMLGAYFGFFVMSSNIQNGILMELVAFIVAMAGCAVIGVVMEKTCYKPLRNSPRLNALITAIGVSMLLENGGIALPFIGPNPRQFPDFTQLLSVFKSMADGLKSSIGFTIAPMQLMVILVSVVLMLILYYIVNFTRVGKAMRAVSYDMNAAKLMGIPVDRIISITFAIGAALAAAAGILFAISFPQITPTMGIMPGLKCFIAAVLGGIGSIPGAMLGGVVIGLVESLTKGYISSLWSDGIVFTILIIILSVRPTGILGKLTREKV